MGLNRHNFARAILISPPAEHSAQSSHERGHALLPMARIKYLKFICGFDRVSAVDAALRHVTALVAVVVAAADVWGVVSVAVGSLACGHNADYFNGAESVSPVADGRRLPLRESRRAHPERN